MERTGNALKKLCQPVVEEIARHYITEKAVFFLSVKNVMGWEWVAYS